MMLENECKAWKTQESTFSNSEMTFIFAHIIKPLPQSPVTFHSPIKSKWITQAPPTIFF